MTLFRDAFYPFHLILRRTVRSVSKDGLLAPEYAAHPSRRARALLRRRVRGWQALNTFLAEGH
jgi:hypothetical protein